jgi:hypothetical protein
MATKTAAKKNAPAKKTETKTQPRNQDSVKLEFTAAGVQTPVPEDLAALESEREELHKPGRASKTDAEQIDNSPGYNKDQLAHMREYWGLTDSTALESEAGQVIEVYE